MLPDKPWSFEVIARLVAAVFVCLMLGQVANLMLRYHPSSATLSPGWFFTEACTAALSLTGALVAVLRPWTAARWRGRGMFLLICFYTALALMFFAQRGGGAASLKPTVLSMIVTALAFQGATIGLVWFLARQQGWRLSDAFGFHTNQRRAIQLGLTVAFAAVPIGLGLNYALMTTAKALNITLPIQDSVMIVRLADSWFDRIALAGVTIILAPLAEELLFRGIGYHTLQRFISPKAALWVSSLVFAAFHFNVLTFIPLLLLSLVLTLLYQRTGNLLAPILCHAAFNAANFVLLFVSDKINSQSLPPS